MSDIDMREDGSGESNSAPFNMALKSLEAIHDIKRSITIASSKAYTGDISQGKAQHLKYTLVKQLFIQSLCLITKEPQEYKDEVWLQLKQLRPQWKMLQNSNRKVVGSSEFASQDVEERLDELTMKILDKLQTEGYFMPPKNDVGLTWRKTGG